MSKSKESNVPSKTIKTTLSGPGFHIGPGVPPCSLKLPGSILEAAGLRPSDQIELVAEAGAIRIIKVGDPLPGLPNISPKNEILDNLMRLTREHEDRQKAARSGTIELDEEQDTLDDSEAPAPLLVSSEEQQ